MKDDVNQGKYPSGFWSINIGHLGTMAVTIFAIGVGYAKIQSSIELETQARRYGDAALEQRIAAVEAIAPQLGSLTREMSELKIEMRYLRETLGELRSQGKTRVTTNP